METDFRRRLRSNRRAVPRALKTGGFCATLSYLTLVNWWNNDRVSLVMHFTKTYMLKHHLQGFHGIIFAHWLYLFQKHGEHSCCLNCYVVKSWNPLLSRDHAQRRRNSNGHLITAQVKLVRENRCVTGHARDCFRLKTQCIVGELVVHLKMGKQMGPI